MSAPTTERRCAWCKTRDREQVQDLREALGLDRTAYPADDAAWAAVIAMTVELRRDRALRSAALNRVHKLWALAQTRAGIVLADDLASAMYLGEDERR